MCDCQVHPSAETASWRACASDRKTAIRHRRRFAGLPSQVKHARRFVARSLDGFADLETAVLLTSELVTNALTHSTSGAPGGKFDVTVVADRSGVRVEVGDRGAESRPRPQQRGPFDISEHGRGLDLVAALAWRWGCEERPYGAGRVVWFELRGAPDLAPRREDRPEGR